MAFGSFFPRTRSVSRSNSICQANRRRRARKGPAGCRLFIEMLEDRTVLSTINWNNPAGGDWDVASNWDLGRLPASGDDVVINIAVTGPITHSQNLTDSINSFTASDPFIVSEGTLNVATTVASTSTFTFEGGTMGNATVQAGTTISCTTSSGDLNAVTLNGNLDLASRISSINISGGLTLNGTAYVGNSSGTTFSFLFFNGTQTLGGNGSVLLGASSGNELEVQSGTLTVASGFVAGGQSGSITGSLANQGTIQADSGGTLIVSGATNFANGTLTGGTWQAVQSSKLDLIGANIATNAANILLDGASSAIHSDQNGTNALASFTTNAAAGTFALQNGATVLTSGAFTNAGTLIIGPGAEFSPSGTFTQTQGTTILNGGTLDPNTVSIQGGTLSGPGTIQGNLVNGGEWTSGALPGSSP
jgi:fibronectin-binding autotransporter adhesin